MFLRHRRLNGGGASFVFHQYDLSESCFDLNGIFLPIAVGARNTYYEPGAKGGRTPANFFRNHEGPRQTYLNRILTGLAGRGQRQPNLFAVTSTDLPSTVSLQSNWIDVLRQNQNNKIVFDGRLQDLITWIFRFGVPVLDGRTASIAENVGNGELRTRLNIQLTPLPETNPLLVNLLLDFLGLSRPELDTLLPMLNAVDPTHWNEGRAIVPEDIQAEMLQEFGNTESIREPKVVRRTNEAQRVEVDERIKRMVRIAIASYPAVILVGPPGTGKTTLIKEILNDLAENYQNYGLTRAPKGAKWVTPDESWTIRDLVGGITVDERSQLRFRPGYILDAIQADAWLILDEANRADMDKIFGGLLTWLSDFSVQLGKSSTALNAPSVEIGWSDGSNSLAIGVERLSEETISSSEPIQFLAGKDWRLLGTYNPLDAQRVFRFGQALSRRFIEIPIPAPSVEEFQRTIQSNFDDLPNDIGERLINLYACHWEDVRTRLGPAIFLSSIPYIRNSLALQTATALQDQPDLDDYDSATPSQQKVVEADLSSESTETANAEEVSADATHNSSVLDNSSSQIFAEAYLASAGKYLAKLEEEDLDRLGERIVSSNALPRAEWQWITQLLSDLA